MRGRRPPRGPHPWLYVEQYHLIQMLCGGTGVVGVTDDVEVTDVADISGVAGITGGTV